MPRWYPVFWSVAVMHLVIGVCLVVSPSPISGVTGPITALRVLAAASLNHALVGMIYLTASGLAIYRLHERIEGRFGFGLLTLQALLILASGSAAMYQAAVHAYADGVPRPFLFIGPDQLFLMAWAVTHSIGMVMAHPGRSIV